MRRLIRDFSLVLIIAGGLLLVDAAVTLLWQEPLTAVIALIKRDNVDKRLLSYRGAPLSQLELRGLAVLRTERQRIAYLAREERKEVKTGQAIGVLQMPRLGANYTVVQGTDNSSLQKGPGHYPGTTFPGLGDTVAIAGHRTTYLAPFRNINQLRPGDRIVLTTRYGQFTYKVQYNKVVQPTAWWVTRNVGYGRLVLSACNPLYSASQRIVTFARFQSVLPVGPAVVRRSI